MNAVNDSATALIRAPLEATLKKQRAAYFANPVPDHAARCADLRKLERFVREHQDAICDAISADYGNRSRHETLLTEVMPVLKSIHHTLKHLKRWMRPQRRGVDRLAFGLASNRVIPQPLGVVGVIVPWNFPLNLSLVPLAAIFAAGNRAMVKMSENSRHLAQLLIQEMPDYFPEEKLQFFDETGGVGIEFSKLPFDHLLFTGSGQTGKAVMAAAASNLCPVTLELGGKSPAIVCEDFPLRTAAERLLYVKYLNAGQICTTVDHVYVPQRRIKEFVKLAQEIVPRRYPKLDTTDYTAIIDEIAYARLLHALDEAKQRGAQVISLIPGKPFDAELRKIAPHLVLDAPADCLLMQREIFGPILPVIAYEDLEDDVIKPINAGPRPLALYPFTNDRAVQQELLTRVMSGGVSINDALFHVGQEDLPFGGVGASGMGHYHGHEGFLTFSKLRPVFTQSRFSSAKLLAPPYGPLTDRLLKFLLK
ncbi:MAG: coniferyl aldehyde dehydrogenase [Burkholderiaceae bacterium]|jgi:coniferyl-aldehyde dehydrogenase|nr:coniferyl aldehyde dehydrogenase [Burkholderiaceae bacterium]